MYNVLFMLLQVTNWKQFYPIIKYLLLAIFSLFPVHFCFFADTWLLFSFLRF